LIDKKYGKLIYISSSLSRYVAEGFFAYAGAKSAVDAMARTLAMELGPKGIITNFIASGLIETGVTADYPKEPKEMIVKFTPLKRVDAPVDVANVVLFLVSLSILFSKA
jgi:3-oxoacyl-[acyl-carrier protein] reductase